MDNSTVKEHKCDIKQCTTVQLQEIFDRQKNLLANKGCLNLLPDKGRRIQTFHDAIAKELSTRDSVTIAAELFSELNISTTGKDFTNQIEWDRKNNQSSDPSQSITSGNDVEATNHSDTDVLKIIAQSRSTTKQIEVETEEPKLITEEDLREIESFKNENVDLEPHAMYICDFEDRLHTNRPKFKPYRTTIGNAHDLEKEKCRKLGKHWEVTSATPPIIRNTETKILSLQDSINIQRFQTEKLQKLQLEQAEQRLRNRVKLTDSLIATNPSEPVPSSSTVTKDLTMFFKTYRDVLDSDANESSDSSSTTEYDSDDGSIEGDEDPRKNVNYG